MAEKRRVVVTGMGIACPLGLGVENVWKRLTSSESGISAIQAFDTKDLPAKVAGQVPAGSKDEGRLNLDEWIPHKDQKKMDRFIHLGLVAAIEAVEDSGWKPEDEDDRCATGVMIGSGIGGLQTIYEASVQVHEGKARRLSPFFIPSALINLVSGHVSIKYGFKGPNHSVVTACATGVHAIGDAARLILLGRCRRDGGGRRRGGGLRARHCRVLRRARALHRLQRRPAARLAPLGQGPRRLRHGRGRRRAWCSRNTSTPGAAARRSMPRSCGYGLSGDAYHITAPAEGHDGAFRAMKAAFKNGGIGAGGRAVRQRARHLDPARRRPRARGGGALLRRCREGRRDVVHQIGDRAPARRGGRGGGASSRSSRSATAWRRPRSISTSRAGTA